MTISIKEIKLSNESRVKILLQDSLPLFYPNLYILKKLRFRSPNTQQKFLSDLRFFFVWLRLEGIDLEERLRKRPSPDYLTEPELIRLSNQVHWTKETLDKLSLGISIHPNSYCQVGLAQVESRMVTVKKYLSFLYQSLGDPQDSISVIEKMEKRIDLTIRELRPTLRRRPIDPKGLTDEQEEILLTKLHPDSEDNPWPRNEPVRVRNYLIIFLLFSLGVRRGEMLGIKLADINFKENTIRIIHRPNDPDDQRKTEPLVKTNERKLPAPEPLMALINLYTTKYRRSNRAKKHPYLLVSHGKTEGAPLAIKSIDALFNTAKKKFPALKGVSSHSLRHHDVYRTVKMICKRTEDNPIEDRMQQERRVLTYKYGWSDHSNMPNLYGQKYHQEQADKAMVERNSSLLSHEKEIEKDDTQ